jgi:hypothetical protein
VYDAMPAASTGVRRGVQTRHQCALSGYPARELSAVVAGVFTDHSAGTAALEKLRAMERS